MIEQDERPRHVLGPGFANLPKLETTVRSPRLRYRIGDVTHREKKQETVTVLQHAWSSLVLGGVFTLASWEDEDANYLDTSRAGNSCLYFSPFMKPMVYFPDQLVLPPDSAEFAFLSTTASYRYRSVCPLAGLNRGTTRLG